MSQNLEIVTCKDCKYNDKDTCYIDGLMSIFYSGERKE